MSFAGSNLNTPLTLNAQIAQIQQNKFLTDAQKATQIAALQAQLNQVLKTGYTGNTSGSPQSPASIQKIFQDQQLLTKILGARAAAVTATPEFVQTKATGGSLQDLNAQLTKQGVFVTTPELNAFNNLIQNVPLTPSDKTHVDNLLSRINSPIITSGSAGTAQDLFNYLQRHGALNPNPTPNTTSVQSSPAAGGGYQPPSNLPQVSIPSNFSNLPNLGLPPTTPIKLDVNIPNLPSSPGAGGGTSSGGGSGLTPPTGSDLTSLLSNPLVLLGIVIVIGAVLFITLRSRKK